METIPRGYQKTKVGIIPNDWELARIDSVLQRVKNKVEVVGTEEYQQIGIRSHAKGIFHKEFVTGEELGNKSVFWIKENCFIVNIVFAWEHAISKTTEKERGMISSHRFPMYEPKDNKVDIDYILYFFKSKKGKHLLGIASPGGAGRNKTLGQGEFSELKIPVPSIKEQKKIVEVLTTIDNLIIKQEELINSKEKQFKGLMQRLVTGIFRFNGFIDEWSNVKLGEITTVTTGNSNKQDSRLNGEFAFFDRSEDIRRSNRYLFDAEAVIVAGEGQKFFPKYFVGKFDLHQRTYAIIDFKNVIGKYIYYYISENSNYFLAQAVGSTVKSLRLPMFNNMPIKLPKVEEQKKIVEVLTHADKQISLLKNELQELKQERKSLMQKLLTGKVRVN